MDSSERKPVIGSSVPKDNPSNYIESVNKVKAVKRDDKTGERVGIGKANKPMR